MIFYVTKDIERAVGIDLEAYPDIRVVSNTSPLANLLAEKYPEQVILTPPSPSLNKGGIKGGLSTLGLLKRFRGEILDLSTRVREDRISGDSIARPDKSRNSLQNDNIKILVFKNTPQIERLCQAQGWQLLNAPAQLVNKFERKISQYKWFSYLGWLKKNAAALKFSLVPSKIDKLGNLEFRLLVNNFGLPFVLQYNIGHTGESTKLISDRQEFENMQGLFAGRAVKISEFIKGKVYTVNACVSAKKMLSHKNCAIKVIVGEISLQLTGLPELTDNPLTTVGNDWATSLLNKEGPGEVNFAEQVKQVAVELGRAMAQEGWRGLFGIDVVVKEGTQDIYLIEVNARQPASVSFETQLAHLQGASGPMDWQLASLAGQSYKLQVTSYKLSASQFALRKNEGSAWEQLKDVTKVGEYDESGKLINEEPYFEVTSKSNKYVIPEATCGSELFRVQQVGPY